jgi:retron-type reverse transcriptase
MSFTYRQSGRQPNRPNSPTDWYRRRQKARRARATEIVDREPQLANIIHPENLIRVYYELRSQGGPAPGPDGLTYQDLSYSEVAEVLRQYAQALREKAYRPQPCRLQRIPKSSGNGYRTLRIATIWDRVVATALHQALSPMWERVFLPCSYGFRRHREVRHMLATVEVAAVAQGRWVLAVDDVQNAFDNVVLKHLLADHRRHLKDRDLLALINFVLRGHEGPRRKVGIDQGGAYSPTALNVRLHHAHDLALTTEAVNASVFRYADNLVYACASLPEAEQVLAQARDLLEVTGLTLKGADGPPLDLRQGGTVTLLGFTMARREDNTLCFGLGEESWARLTQNLEGAHEEPDPPATARQSLLGWVAACGPAVESLEQTGAAERLLDAAARCGFREVATLEEIAHRWRQSWLSWQRLRDSVWRKCPSSVHEGEVMLPASK